MSMRRIVAIALLATLCAAMVSGCDRVAGPAVAGPHGAAEAAAIPQHLKILIDGYPLAIDPDRPVDRQVATATIVNGKLMISAVDKVTDNMLAIEAPFPGEPAAGELSSYLCKPVFGCEEPPADPPLSGTMLFPAPNANRPANHGWAAHKAPKLGLQPLVVTLESIQPVHWPGVGAAWRIKGSFRGTLADTVEDWSAPRIVGPTRPVEGQFDMYAQKL